MIGGPAVLLGQLVGISFATGLNLYATVALLGLAIRLGWIGGMPPEIMGLANPLVITTAAALYLVEFIADKIRYVDTLWDTLHTFIRPPAAALLALAAFAPLPLDLRLAAAAIAGSVALLAHGTKAGLRLAINASPAHRITILISIAEDIAAVALALAALRYPAAALGLTATALLLIALFGPRLWRAFLLGIRAIAARVRGFFGSAGWRSVDELPPDLRALLDAPVIGHAPLRSCRAAIKGLAGVGAYRNGWIVIAPDAPIFLYRALFRPRRLQLPAFHTAHARDGLLANVLILDTDRTRCTLFLLKDGPSADTARADLAAVRR